MNPYFLICHLIAFIVVLSTVQYKKKLQIGFFAMADQSFAKIVNIRVTCTIYYGAISTES